MSRVCFHIGFATNTKCAVNLLNILSFQLEFSSVVAIFLATSCDKLLKTDQHYVTTLFTNT